MIALFLAFSGISITFCIVSVPICITTNSIDRWYSSLLSTPSPVFTVCRFFDDNHSGCSEVISYFSIDLHFSNNGQCWTCFHELLLHSYCLENTVQSCLLYHRSIGYKCMALFMCSLSCFIDVFFSVSLPVPYCFDDCS